MKRLPRLALTGALAAAVCPALAQTPTPAELQACAALEIDAERLACYDRAVNRRPAAVDAADEAAQAASEAKDSIRAYRRLQRERLPPLERTQQVISDLFDSEQRVPAVEERIANAGKGSLLDSRWELARGSKLGTFNFRAYKPVYLLPVFWGSARNQTPTSSNPDLPPASLDLKDTEAKFQLSFKTKAVENLFGDNGDLWLGYTQSSRWQVFDGEQSRPFRETNYEPEALLVFRTRYRLGGWNGRLFGIGVNHQSNGRADPTSRSWNRVIAQVGMDRDDWALVVRPWWRIPDGSEDENPHIQDYVGRFDATLVHRRGRHEFALMGRHSLRGGDRSRGALQFDWGFPLTDSLRGHVQVFDGYGESLIDYDRRGTYIGLGVSLLEWY